jgi:enoyl-CoA hydratase
VSDAPTFSTLLCEIEQNVGVIALNRPEVLNALNSTLMNELKQALARFDADDAIGCIVIKGSEKAFAAGADIKEMQSRSFADSYLGRYLADRDAIASQRKPVIAAVSGFALGGGCELAMMCDIIIAAESAKFGQPEITLGIIPGADGTQRLARAVGKAKAMDLILTGRTMDAAEAERAGLIARVVPDARLMEETMAVARRIASLSRLATLAAKEAINRTFESSLAEGVRFERRLFEALFGTEDQKEGHGGFHCQAQTGVPPPLIAVDAAVRRLYKPANPDGSNHRIQSHVSGKLSWRTLVRQRRQPAFPHGARSSTRTV